MSAGGYGYYAGGVGAPPMAPPLSTPSSAATTSSSLYGGEHQRPTFSEDGQGAPYSTTLNIVSGQKYGDVSYDTSSKDPHMIRARVFIGNIARAIITRDDIIDLFAKFGKILAVNYFAQQGFGFVQFNEASQADKSCLSLNGTQWKSCVLDVHLAMLGAMTKKPTTGAGGGGGGGGRDSHATLLVPPVNMAGAAAAAAVPSSGARHEPHNSGKRAYEEEEYEIFKQNKRNKQFANSDKTVNEELMPNEMCDTMVCGYCRFVTSDFEEFKEHRIAGCQRWKDPDEPRHRLKCATCNQRFIGAWGLLEHLTEFHRMLLYNEEKLTPADLINMRQNGGGGGGASTPSSNHEAPPPPTTTTTTTGGVTSSAFDGATPHSDTSTTMTPAQMSSATGTPLI